MIRQQIRVALLAGSLVTATALTARADDGPQPAAAAPAADPCTPQYRTVSVKEWVPEKYQSTRTVYDRVCREEKYTAYRCECVPETKSRTVTTYRQEVKEVVRHVSACVPVVEERTVMKAHWTCVPATRVVRKCVDKGHYECREVPCGPSFMDRLRKLCQRHNDCCDDCCEPCPVRTKTVKVWVPCPVWEERTVCYTKRICEHIPVKCHVKVYKTEIKEQKCRVTCCVPETRTESYTCLVQKKVPYEATRTVVHCVPREEKVTYTRMVCRTVQKQVPVETCCETTCCKPRLFQRCGGLGFRHHGCCD